MKDHNVEIDAEFSSAPPAAPRPRTATVLGMLTATAAILSYLGSYAMSSALVAAEVVRPWPHDHDPRFKWFLTGFVVLLTLFTGVGAVARYVSARHLRRIEQMETEA